MKHTAVISGVGMVPFAKPGASAPYYQMGAEAARQALADAGLAELVDLATFHPQPSDNGSQRIVKKSKSRR